MANDDGHCYFFAHLNTMKAASSLTLSKWISGYFQKLCSGDLTTLETQWAWNMVFQRYIKAQLTTQMVQPTSPHALPPMHRYMALPGIPTCGRAHGKGRCRSHSLIFVNALWSLKSIPSLCALCGFLFGKLCCRPPALLFSPARLWHSGVYELLP